MFLLSFPKQLVPFLLHQVSCHASMLQFEQESLPEESNEDTTLKSYINWIILYTSWWRPAEIGFCDSTGAMKSQGMTLVPTI